MNTEIRSLTGLRGIAALYVAIHHIHSTDGGGLSYVFVRHGYLAVDLFFVLSGFVLAMNYGKLFQGSFTWGTYAGFLTKRIARVYPLYLFVTLGITFIWVKWGGGVLDGSLLAVVTANTFLIQTWGIASSIARPAWSLSAEWAAYLLFPLFAAILIHGRRAFAVAGAVACLAAIIVVSLSESSFVLGSQAHRSGTLDLHSFDSPAPMVRCIAGFGLGLVAYRLREVGIVQSLLGNKRISHSVCAAVLVMLCIPRSDIAVVVLFPALIISLSFQRGLLARVLSSNAIFAIGVWSYSIYLLHRPFFIMQDAIAERLAAYSLSSAEGLATLLTIIVVITLSAIAYNLIENPGRGFINRLFGYSTRNATAPDKPGL